MVQHKSTPTPRKSTQNVVFGHQEIICVVIFKDQKVFKYLNSHELSINPNFFFFHSVLFFHYGFYYFHYVFSNFKHTFF